MIRLPNMTHDFVVIGGGVIGLCSALALRQTGASVLLMEAASVGSGASWAGGGILSPLLPWEYPQHVAELAARGAAMYQAWTDELHAVSGLDSEYHRSGMIVVAPFDAEAAIAWGASTQTAVETGLSWLDDRPALRVPSIAQVRNPRLLAALLATAHASGINVLENTAVESLVEKGDSIHALRTANGELHADAFVVAAGAWTPSLIPAADLAIKPIRGQMLLFGAGTEAPENILYRDGIYLIPRRDGQILVGSTREDVGFDCSTTLHAREQLSRAAFDIWPALRQAALLKHWAGLRPMRPGNAPIIDRHPGFKNLFINAGHGRYGLTMAPASAGILLTRIGLSASTDPLDQAFGMNSTAQLDKVQIVG